MCVYRRGDIYWFEFLYKGRRIRQSTKQTNQRVARQMEAAYKTGLVKGAIGLSEPKPVPTFAEFAKQFRKSVETQCAAKPSTVEFYFCKLDRLLEFAPLVQARLDEVDEAMIDSYVQHRRACLHHDKPISPGQINRELATVRKALRLAQEWRIINRVPRIRLLPGERTRDYVMSRDQERVYLEFAPQPLKDAAILMLDAPLRVGEVVALEWRDVTFAPAPGAPHGFLNIRRGKTANARRFIPLTARAAAMLKNRQTGSQSAFVFTDESGTAPLSRSTLRDQHARMRRMLKLPADSVIHSFRHTACTRLGEAGADAFAIMRLAGHSSVTVSQKYVHPSAEAVGLAIQRLEAMNAGKLLPEGPKMLEPPTKFPTAESEPVEAPAQVL
ncbi:MAG TPA: tyrosine-type recombinase/integrase [Terriglobia bacterium]|jgi:integrase|nr:tyrosine-type recombinase/integrase [Terriglobia bacterium]